MSSTTTIILAFALLFSPSYPTVTALQIHETFRPTSSQSTRREALFTTLTTATLTLSQPSQSAAAPPPNPLNLKGSFWETGELYVKKESALPEDPDELLPSLQTVATALSSPDLRDLAVDGNYSTLLRTIRTGGTVSESVVRTRGYALLDILSDRNDRNEDESDRRSYLCEQKFRVLLDRLQILDATVEAAARRGKVDGGLVEAVGTAVVLPFVAASELVEGKMGDGRGRDPRLDVLAALEDAAKAARVFVKAAEEASM